MNKPQCVLLDIEGTTSSISFVYDVMFPYVRTNLESFLDRNWDSPAVRDCLSLLADELKFESVANWLGGDREVAQRRVAEGVIKLMDDDIKVTGLKKLQGAIWKDGFESGQLTAHLFDDVADSISIWCASGIEVRIYSSGSIQAQQLFFGHTIAGDLLPKIRGHYDTTIGAKKDSASYLAIASDCSISPEDFLFVSDVAAELDAAQQAGMQIVLSVRPGNKIVENTGDYCSVCSFSEINFSETCV